MSPIHRTWSICFAFLAAATCAISAAQNAQSPPPKDTTGNPAVQSPGTPGADVGQPSATTPNTVDQVVARQLAIGGRHEVELGKLAGDRAQDADVKTFARRMVDDHTKSHQKVLQLAKTHRVAIPKDPDPDQRAVRAQLEKLRGETFDLAYINAQVGDHQATAHLLEHEIGSGQDARTKALAMETLPTVLNHLEAARAIQVRLISR
jgi:putative membrane protein